MDALLTAAELRDVYKVETDLDDKALDELVLAETREIQRRSGVVDDMVQYYRLSSSTSYIELPRPASAVVSVEVDGDLLVTADYEQKSPTVLYRTDGSWGRFIKVVYTPENAAALIAQQRMVLVQLVKLYVAYNGHSLITGPDVSVHPLDYTKERDRLLSVFSTDEVDWIFV